MLIPNKITVTYDAISPDGKKYSEKTESNAVNTEILTYSVSKKIRSDKTAVRAGETVRYTATLTNDSAAELFDIFFKVPQPENGATVVQSYNGLLYTGYKHGRNCCNRVCNKSRKTDSNACYSIRNV